MEPKEQITALKIPDIFEYINPAFFNRDRNKPYITNKNYYEWYYALGKYYQPESFLEIGVRFGYSMMSVVTGAIDTIKHVQGYDNESYGETRDKVASSNQIARDHMELLLTGKNIKFDIDRMDTVKELGELSRSYDLIHIDGDHSYKGAQHDMDLTIGKAKVIMVDDYYNCVRRPADDWIEEHADIIERTFEIADERGMIVIEYKD